MLIRKIINYIRYGKFVSYYPYYNVRDHMGRFTTKEQSYRDSINYRGN